MTKYRKIIAIIAGGNSSEELISLKSAAQVLEALNRELFNPYLVRMKGREWHVQIDGEQLPVDLNDFSFLLQGHRVQFEYALIMVHGTPGENGLMQGYFEMMSIPYSTCGVETSAVTFNKSLTKRILSNHESIHLAREVLVERNDTVDAGQVVAQLGLPLFVKPNASGSSFGVTKVKKIDQLLPAIEAAFSESDQVLLEQFIEGREVSCGVMIIDGKEWILPVTELITENEFFDIEAKYTAGKCSEVTPADFPPVVIQQLNTSTSVAYKVLGCRGVVRIDFIVQKGSDIPYFIEVNTVPGMTGASIIPQQWREAGLTMSDALTMIINATTNK